MRDFCAQQGGTHHTERFSEGARHTAANWETGRLSRLFGQWWKCSLPAWNRAHARVGPRASMRRGDVRKKGLTITGSLRSEILLPTALSRQALRSDVHEVLQPALVSITAIVFPIFRTGSTAHGSSRQPTGFFPIC